MNKNKFYITTPIYYVNSKPHVGTLYSTLLADAAARWQKLMGKKVLFLTGTDEHGQKVAEKALELGMEPQAFVDSMIPNFQKIWQLYNIEYDIFMRTSNPSHKASVTKWIEKLQAQDDIYKSEYTGWYCVPDETFVTVESTGKKDAAGNWLCPQCDRPLREIAEESYFFRLSAYEERLLQFYQDNPHFITPKERMNEVLSFVKSGLRDLSLSRKTVKWGIPFPGDPSHTVYVWGDALNNYINALGYGSNELPECENFNFWWPADVHVMAKDIVRFHAVYWPAFLIAAGLQLPKKLLVHGYVLMGDKKMSKSLGNVIDPELLAQRYGVDQVRYYLLRQMAITQDGQFLLSDLEDHVTAELAHGIGNLLSRTITLALKNNLKTVKPPQEWHHASKVLRARCEEAYRFYWEEMNHGMFHVALNELWKFIAQVNAYFHEQQPWKLGQESAEHFAEVIAASCHSLYAIGIMLWPIMPQKMEALLAVLGYQFDPTLNYEEILRKNEWNKVFTLSELKEPLFTRPEQWSKTLEQPEKKDEAAMIDYITIDDFVKVDMRVGTILECVKIPESDKLLKMQVDLGEEKPRQILAGLAKRYIPEDLIGKQGVFVCNLKPRKMAGYESQGMMLVAKDDQDHVVRVIPEEAIANTSKLT